MKVAEINQWGNVATLTLENVLINLSQLQG